MYLYLHLEGFDGVSGNFYEMSNMSWTIKGQYARLLAQVKEEWSVPTYILLRVDP